MKKIMLIALLTIGLFSYFAFAQNTTLIDSIIQNIASTNQNKTTTEKIKNYEKYTQIISNNTNIDSKTKTALIKFIKAKSSELQKTNTTTTTSSSGSSQTIIGTEIDIPNVNKEKLRSTWLARHNQERSTLGLDAYTYDTRLEKTANTRSDYLVQIGKSTHQRNASDGYYNYDIIKQRFNDQGIEFVATQDTLFSENIGRRLASCKKSDCTDQTIAVMKKVFEFFMSEKKRKGPHYKSVISKAFTQIGMGISIDPKTNKYFVVTHYSVALK